jgi:ketosteroid isomerase-like protein
MARPHVDTVHANSAAFSRRDVDAMLGYYARDAVVFDRRPIGWGEFRGHDALRSYYQGLFDNADDLSEALEVVSQQGDTVIAACRLEAHLAGQPDGVPVTFEYALRIEFNKGLIAIVEIFDDAEAAAAQ